MKKSLLVLILIILSFREGRGDDYSFLKKFHGFVEFASSLRLGDEYTKHPDYNLLESRLQLKLRRFPENPPILYDWNAVFDFKAEFLTDAYFGGKTKAILRELNLTISPTSKLDLKIGRQIFTWGTGDYIFINDVFPKDYVSFFIGRDDEYLKAPSWGIKASYFGKLFWTDVVFIPYFEPNVTVKGDRLSFYDTLLGRQAGRESDWFKREPPFQLENSQVALRFYKQAGSLEWAVYLYRGFYTNPKGYKNPDNFEVYYPRLNVYGASIRGPFWAGIGSLEFGYYDSVEDRSGKERFIQNPSLKFLAGYTRDFKNDLNIGFQYYYEQILKYSQYKESLTPQDVIYDQYRHLLTFSLTKKFRNQTIVWRNFLFVSPSDRDAYLRESISYDVNDYLKVVLGANFFWGEDDWTEFGQIEGNSNIYLRVRYSF